MSLVSSCSCICAIYWSQVLNREWRCSWSSANRQCSNYIWVVNNFIACQDTPYIRDLTVLQITYKYTKDNQNHQYSTTYIFYAINCSINCVQACFRHIVNSLTHWPQCRASILFSDNTLTLMVSFLISATCVIHAVWEFEWQANCHLPKITSMLIFLYKQNW